MTKKSKDYDVRACVVRKLLKEGVPRGDIRHEIANVGDTGHARADIVAIIHNRLCGFELKSASDVTTKAKSQIETYRYYFDFVFLVGDAAHYDALKSVTRRAIIYHHQAQCLDFGNAPNTYEYSRFSQYADGWGSEVTGVSYMGRLLTSGEGEAACEKLKIEKPVNHTWFLKELKEHASLKELRSCVIEALRNRPLSKREITFWTQFDAENQKVAA